MSLGLAPLEVDDAPKVCVILSRFSLALVCSRLNHCVSFQVRDAEDGETGDKLVNEDGFEFRHRVAVDLTKKKAEEKLKEKLAVCSFPLVKIVLLQTAKAKREVYNRVLKGAKGLAEDSDDDDGGATSWVERQRRLEEDKKKVADRVCLFCDCHSIIFRTRSSTTWTKRRSPEPTSRTRSARQLVQRPSNALSSKLRMLVFFYSF